MEVIAEQENLSDFPLRLAGVELQLRSTYQSDWKGSDMSATDKIKNKVEEVKGKAKEVVADITDNDDLKAEGKKDQTKADLRDAGEKVKDALPGN